MLFRSIFPVAIGWWRRCFEEFASLIDKGGFCV
jgi:hypothetical protein